LDEPLTNRVVDDVGHYDFSALLIAENTIVAAILPKGIAVSSPKSESGSLFGELRESRDIGRLGLAVEQQMHVIGRGGRDILLARRQRRCRV
jgi:hypothetical protein